MARKDKPPKETPFVRSRRGSNMAQTQIWLTPELRAAVALVQAKENASMGDVVRSAVVWFFKQHYPWALAQGKVPEEQVAKQSV